jgi:hypothetical protein
MSWTRPIFNEGIAGANRAVVNSWTQGAATAIDNRDTLRWARREMGAGQIVTMGLCEVRNASAIAGAGYRWTYTVRLWFPPPLTGSGVTVGTDLTFDYTNCINLREYHNTATRVDGVAVNATPADQFGPVGSQYSGGNWTTSELSAKVLVHVVMDTAGNAFPFFDRPNPYRCI